MPCIIVALLTLGAQPEAELAPSAVGNTEQAAPDADAGPSAAPPEGASATADAASDDRSAVPPEEAEPSSAVDWREVADDILNSGAMGELRRGGFFMWPILLLGK